MKSNNDKKYDLEERTFVYAKNVTEYVRNLPKGIGLSEIGKQLVRSAGSVGANYIEANECLSKKDFIMRVKICKKEAKESHYWLNLSIPIKIHESTKLELMCESEELQKIFGAIIRNSSANSSA
jgi:four helix bundle protein